MIHDRVEALVATVLGLVFGGISFLTSAQIVISCVAGLFAIVASCMAIRYYYYATKKQR